MELNVLHLGDCLEILPTLPDNSVDSIVTDPPAGISFMNTTWDDPGQLEAIIEQMDGPTRLRERKAFITFLCQVFEHCLRVLKPGGHILVWSLPRTSHWTATAIEDAGFEIRDSISHVFSQGFAKGLNVSKAIDKKAGAERKVIKKGQGVKKPRTNPQFTSIMTSNVGINTEAFNARIGEVTEPATDEAKTWNGWGTCLKPAVEIWWLCRKPLVEKTIVAQVLKTGTGAIHVDACRIRNTGRDPSRETTTRRTPVAGDQRPGKSKGMYAEGSSFEPTNSPKGRWPANLVLSHSEKCRQVGVQEVKAHTNNRFDDGMKPFGNGAGHAYTTTGGGTEELPLYECVEGCPILALNAQSGNRPSTLTGRANPNDSHENPGDNHGKSTFGGGNSRVYADDGGIARCFANFEPDYEEPFIYTGKASPKDKNADLAEEGLINSHPTVKSQALMTYLVKLVTPPGGIVLDPFAGSGSTLVAAANNEFQYIGIERDPTFHQLATVRVDKALGRTRRYRAQRDIFDSMDDLFQDP